MVRDPAGRRPSGAGRGDHHTKEAPRRPPDGSETSHPPPPARYGLSRRATNMQTTERRAFDALRVPGFRAFLVTFMLTMMADNIEHVMSYWVAFQKFHSPALGGFAVVSHWVPYLVFSVAGRRAQRSVRLAAPHPDAAPRSSCWCPSDGATSSSPAPSQMWHAMVLLVLHGCAGVLWLTSSQVLLYDVVGPTALESAVRLNATARYLGMLRGPGVGSIIMRTLGPDARHLLECRVLSPPHPLAGARALRPQVPARQPRPHAPSAASPTSSTRFATFAAFPCSLR